MKLFQSPTFWIVAVVAITIAITVAKRLSRREEPSVKAVNTPPAEPKAPGFREVVKNPELWHQLVSEHEDIEREAEAAQAWNDEQVAQAVRWCVLEVNKGQDARGNLTILRRLGSRTHPEALRILRDPTLRVRLVEATKTEWRHEAPFNRLCELLDKAPPETAKLIVPFTEDPSPEIRRDAVRVLGEIGTEEALAAVQEALEDPDTYVRSCALQGLSTAAQENRISEDTRRNLYGRSLLLLVSGENADEVLEFLLKLDRPRATAYYLSEESLSPQSAVLHRVLQILNEEKIQVPRDRLLALVEKLNKPDLKYPQTYQLSEVLRALGRHELPEDRKVFEGYLVHPEEKVIRGAAAGILASHGLEDFQQRIWKPRDGKGLTVPQRHYSAVFMLDAQVRNGGFSQYFFNSSGDDWRDALAGLEAMESKERLAILREALAKFGPAGPSGDRDKRMAQLAKIASAEEKLFDQLNSRYYESTEIIDVLTMRYVLKNPEAFR